MHTCTPACWCSESTAEEAMAGGWIFPHSSLWGALLHYSYLFCGKLRLPCWGKFLKHFFFTSFQFILSRIVSPDIKNEVTRCVVQYSTVLCTTRVGAVMELARAPDHPARSQKLAVMWITNIAWGKFSKSVWMWVAAICPSNTKQESCTVLENKHTSSWGSVKLTTFNALSDVSV